MTDPLVAHVSMTIDAPRAAVWESLVDPEVIKQYMFVTDVVSDWDVGGPITLRSDWLGKPTETKGTLLRVEPGVVLEYEYVSPLARATDSPRHRHRVTIELADDGPRTRVLVSHDNNVTKKELDHAEGSWRLTLGAMKALLEGTREGVRPPGRLTS